MIDLVHHHKNTYNNHSESQLQSDYKLLNNDQKRIVDNVTTAVYNHKSIHLVVSGQGGTGKTRVIEIISRIISARLPETLPVVVAAPTGLAAYNVGGTTLHRMLSLPVEHGKPSDYRRLQVDELTTIRATLKGLRLLIVDEISMVSSITLLFVHLRLTEIMSNNNLFGGISTVFFGDFFQLPPVKGNQPFVPVTYLEAKQRLGAIGTVDIWSEMTYDELTVNVRQRGDQQYAQLLSNVRTGQLTDEQCAMLQSRLINPQQRPTVNEICSHYAELVSSGEAPVILMPRSASCSEINNAMLQQLGAEIKQLQALDTLDTIVSKRQMPKVTSAYAKVGDDVTRTAGLEKTLNLCTGAKVMLKRNKNVEIGLVNGAAGTVVSFEQDKNSNIQQVVVKFQCMEKPIPVLRESSTFEVLKGIFYTRRQFPLMLAFALTVTRHKVSVYELL